MSEYRQLLDYLQSLEQKISELNQSEIVFCIVLDTTFLKQTVLKELQEWRAAIAKCLKNQTTAHLNDITNFLDEQNKVLAQPPENVETAKKVLVALDLIRDKDVDVDKIISPIEVRTFMS